MALETLGLLGVLYVENIVEEFLIHLCDASLDAKEDLSMFMLASFRYLVE